MLAATLVAGGDQTSACDRFPTSGPPGLPATVALHTTCGGFLVKPDGRVERGRMPTDWPSWAPHVSGRLAAGTYVWRRGNFITAFRRGRIVWRSSRPYPLTESIVAGRNAIAFSVYEGPTYVARLRLGERERPILRGELPVGFTRQGHIFTGYSRGAGTRLALRRLDGSLVRFVATNVRGYAFEQRSRLLFYISTDHQLVRFDGRDSRPLYGLTRDSRWQWPQILDGGLVAVMSDRRLDLVRRDGELFASTTWPRPRPSGYGLMLDTVVAAPSGRAVGVILRARTSERRERVLVGVLRRGARQPSIVYSRRMRVSCGSAGWLSWRGHWLLFPSYDQRVVAVNTLSRRRIELSSLVRALPGRGQPGFKLAFRASWR